ncbi:hypothetical protein L218DRAFT_951334 [Marasmius fiardii PR-910]|nr:hypothetical protein L218DRAFT_951334 [Marasmius fiardii PR-910]
MSWVDATIYLVFEVFHYTYAFLHSLNHSITLRIPSMQETCSPPQHLPTAKVIRQVKELRVAQKSKPRSHQVQFERTRELHNDRQCKSGRDAKPPLYYPSYELASPSFHEAPQATERNGSPHNTTKTHVAYGASALLASTPSHTYLYEGKPGVRMTNVNQQEGQAYEGKLFYIGGNPDTSHWQRPVASGRT